MDRLLFGVAYYDEYMPYDRLEKDIRMMKDAGINVVRAGESTWSTMEPQNGVFNFASIDRVLDAMGKAEIDVIVGTPTYAVPTWLAREHPEVLAVTPQGRNKYGARQNMDITNPIYLFHAERVIRKVLEHVKDHPAVIGYQADNETCHYNSLGPDVQVRFVKYMRDKFKNLETINGEFGLDYWSNRINSWEDFPSAEGTINASLGAEFSKFQRKLVTDFLAWQVGIINEYKKPGQFVTHNFCFDWCGYHCGINPDVNHFAASEAFDIAGVDIYHPGQDKLTGMEISLFGDLGRSMKRKNYLVLETQAQGIAEWVPYPGQLRLQAFGHLASGANMVEYWHWHSIHNACETYWKGLLSHDFEPNPTYEEAKTIGKDFERLSSSLINLRKENRVALLFSNEAHTAFNWFKLPDGKKYNDILMQVYRCLYRMNISCDLVDPSSSNIEDYSMLVVPALYAAPDSLLQRLNRFVENGGHIVYTCRSGFSDENAKVRASRQPGIIGEACGIYYNQFTIPQNVSLKGDPFGVGEENNKVSSLMELIYPTTARVLAYYDHKCWGKYVAITQNIYGKGDATYIGCVVSDAVLEKVLENALNAAGLWGADQELYFPLIVKSGVNGFGKAVHYYFNYSEDENSSFKYPYKSGKELISGNAVNAGDILKLGPWGFVIIEEN